MANGSERVKGELKMLAAQTASAGQLEAKYAKWFHFEPQEVEPDSLEQPSPLEFVPSSASDKLVWTQEDVIQSGNADMGPSTK